MHCCTPHEPAREHFQFPVLLLLLVLHDMAALTTSAHQNLQQRVALLLVVQMTSHGISAYKDAQGLMRINLGRRPRYFRVSI